MTTNAVAGPHAMTDSGPQIEQRGSNALQRLMDIRIGIIPLPMPFAQVATRIGGVITVTFAIIAMAHFKVL
jgi:malate:Na+ symporter